MQTYVLMQWNKLMQLLCFMIDHSCLLHTQKRVHELKELKWWINLYTLLIQSHSVFHPVGQVDPDMLRPPDLPATCSSRRETGDRGWEVKFSHCRQQILYLGFKVKNMDLCTVLVIISSPSFLTIYSQFRSLVTRWLFSQKTANIHLSVSMHIRAKFCGVQNSTPTHRFPVRSCYVRVCVVKHTN